LARLAEFIENGGLRGGDKLPPERELAQRFGVSRDSVREALRVLAERGVVVRRQGDGTYIAVQEQEQLKRVFDEAFAAQSKRLREIFVFRRILEPGVASLAAAAATAEELEQLRKMLDEQARAIEQGRSATALDLAFHHCLARATQNEVLVSVLAAAHETLDESRSAHLWSLKRERISLDGHRKIVQALERRDPEAAGQAMREHLDAVEYEVLAASGTPFK
jgi:GntR family transcriptional repressor for pyruvate dehydrogenase complex